MRKMKDSGIEWIGDIPEKWNIKKLKYVISENVTDGPHETPTFLNEGVPFLSIDSIQNGNILFENCRYVSLSDHLKYCKKCKPQKNDLLLGKAASTGKIAKVNVDFEFSIWSPLALIRINSKNSPFFIEYVLKSSNVQHEIDLMCTFNTQKNISMDDISNLNLIIPPLSDQEKIAIFLDKKCSQIDTILEKQKKSIEKLKQYKQSIITEVVTKGLHPSVSMKDSGFEWIGEIPENWDVKKLKYLFYIFNGATPSSNILNYWNGEIVWITPADMSEDILEIISSQKYITEEGFNSCGTKLIPPGSIIISCRAPIGLVCMAGSELCTNQGCKSLVRKIEMNVKYFYYYLSVQKIKLNSLGNGTTFMELSTNSLLQFISPVPSISEQNCITSYLDETCFKINCIIEQKLKLIEKLEVYKMSIISEAITGEFEIL